MEKFSEKLLGKKKEPWRILKELNSRGQILGGAFKRIYEETFGSVLGETYGLCPKVTPGSISEEAL